MTAYQEKSQIIDKRDAISRVFKKILCFQSSSKVFSPIPKFLMSLEVLICPRTNNP